MRITCFVSFLILVLFSGCSLSLNDNLNRLDGRVSEQPDSVLTVIEKMDTVHFTSREKARLALLKCKALDMKNALGTDETIAMNTVRYFRKHGPKKHLMQSMFYMARTLRNAGKTVDATSAYEKSMELAEQLHDIHYLGLASYDIGSLYSDSFDDISAISFFKKAENYFEEYGKPLYVDYSKFERIRSLLAISKTEEASSLADSLANRDTTDSFYPKVQMLRAHIATLKGNNPETVIGLIGNYDKDFLNITALSDLARAYQQTGHTAIAKEMIDDAISWSGSLIDSVSALNGAYIINKRTGNYKEALSYYEETVKMQDSVLVRRLRNSISSAQRDYLRHETELNKAKNRANRSRYGFCILVSLLLSLFLFYRIIKRRAEIRDKMVALENMQTYLEKTSEQLKFTNESNRRLIKELLGDKIKALALMGDKYFKSEDRLEKDRILKSFEKQLLILRDDKTVFKDVENALNDYCDGIMYKLHEQFPDIKPKTSNILALIYLGLTYEDINLIAKYHSPSSLKTFKSRYKKLFLESDAPDAELFARMLDDN